MKLKTILLAFALLSGTALAQLGQFGGGGSSIPSPASSGLCFQSTGAGVGAWAWSACPSTATFDGISSGTNVSMTAICGTGCSIAVSGSGTNQATSIGALAAADVVSYHTPATGIARTASGSQALVGTELSGDVTTSGSNSTTVAAIGGRTQFAPGVTTSAMGAQSSASCTNITGMTWNIAANKNYTLSCNIPRTLAASATLAYCLGGPGTATSFSLMAMGALGAAGSFAQINTLAQTAYGTKTGASGTAGNTAVDIVWAEIRNGSTASGTALTLQTAANGTNNITVLADASCTLTADN